VEIEAVTPGARPSDASAGSGIATAIPGVAWRKSSRSGPYSDNCVEVAFVGGAIAVRDSKNPSGAVLVFTPEEWLAFVGGAKDGEFDL
jgi:hypothetical protein